MKHYLAYKKFVIAFAHNDYLDDIGGTSKFILSQRNRFFERGYSYVYIAPYRLPRSKPSSKWLVIADNEYKFTGSTEEICNYLSEVAVTSDLCGIFIHHLKNINLVAITQILNLNDCKIWVYIHDFFTVCCGINLVKNDEFYCGDQKGTIGLCDDCKYSNENRILHPKIEEFFEYFEDRLTFVAPSEGCKEIWSKTFNQYEEQVEVINHQIMEGEFRENLEVIGADEDLKIAFLGYKKTIKGWDIFKRIAHESNQRGCKARYYSFSAIYEENLDIENVDVDYNSDNNAMIKALRQYKPHCVLLWSVWPETYSYTLFEAIASNCFIITPEFSGNMSAQVQKLKNGIVLANENELEQLMFNTNRLRELINTFREKGIYGPEELLENNRDVDMIDDCISTKWSVESTKTKRHENGKRGLLLLYTTLQAVKKYYYKIRNTG